MDTRDLARIDKKLNESTKKPANIKMFAGFFIGIGLLLLVFGFYYIGKLKVPEGVAHDQMGHGIETKEVKTCRSEFVMPNQINKRSQQRQYYELNQLFPQIKANNNLKIEFCNGNTINIEPDTFNLYQVLLKKKNKIFLQKVGKKSEKLGQILTMTQVNETKS